MPHIELKFVQVSVLFAVALILNGCNVSSPSGVDPALQRKINEDIRKSDEVLDQFKKSVSRGGFLGFSSFGSSYETKALQ